MLKITNTYELVITKLKRENNLRVSTNANGYILFSYLKNEIKEINQISKIAPYNTISFVPYGLNKQSVYKEISEDVDMLVLVLILRIWLSSKINIRHGITQLNKYGFYTN